MSQKPAPKGNRKMPEPTDDHDAVLAALDEHMPALHGIVREVDEQIRATHPDVLFGVKWGRPHYYLPSQGWIIEIAPYKFTVNIVFYGGAEFDDPPPLGSGESRYIKVDSVHDVTTDQFRAWIVEAGRLPGKK